MSDLHREILESLEFQAMLAGTDLPIGDGLTSAPAPKKPDQQPIPKPKAAAPKKPAAPAPKTPEPVRPAEAKAPDPVPPVTTPSDSPWDRINALIPADSPLAAMTKLDEVTDYIANNVLIEIDAERTNPVPGVGNPDANLMVIGEAPGAEEDKKGEPFVGRAGQLLTKILQAINFEREEIYIANILKSRPPNNRDPLPDEVAAHIPMLYKQIALIKPRIILCVGRTSGTRLLGKDTSLKAMRGTFHDFHGLPVMVTYHPAALLRNPNWKRPTWEDVQLLRTKYDELVAAE